VKEKAARSWPSESLLATAWASSPSVGVVTPTEGELAKSRVRKEHFVLAEFSRLLSVEMAESRAITWDCPVPGGCSLKRPDLLYRFQNFYLQVEVDEYGHEDKSCLDEDARLAVIAADVNLPGLVFRINPDLEGFGCFTAVQLVNGEKALKATKHFSTLMDRVVSEVRRCVAEPPEDGVSQVFIDAGPAPGVHALRTWQQ